MYVLQLIREQNWEDLPCSRLFYNHHMFKCIFHDDCILHSYIRTASDSYFFYGANAIHTKENGHEFGAQDEQDKW